MAFVFFQTFGCQMNVADSDELRRKILNHSYNEVDSIDKADLIVVNTCSVRENAEKKAKARITEFAKIKKPGAHLWVTGCMAQRLGDNLKKQIPAINLVIGAKEIDQMDYIVNTFLPKSNGFEQNDFFNRTETSDFLSIMRGCNNYCAYCIVPYVRGDEISIPLESIVYSVKKRVDEGVKEITLLGQNVNSYNDQGVDFSDLLKRIASVNGLDRVRFTTSHPKDCSEKLIKTIADTSTICHHIHLPVQAGSDRVLSIMNRKYTSAQYMKCIEMIRKYIPDVDLTTDVLAGFPTETDDEFNQTLKLVRDVQFTTAFMFAYSIREGTAASMMEDNINQQTKLDRLSRLIEIQTAITRKIYDSMVGKNVEVMISGRQEKHDKMWMGQDFGCKRVLLTCDNVQAGMILKTTIVRNSGKTLIGDCS